MYDVTRNDDLKTQNLLNIFKIKFKISRDKKQFFAGD